VLGQADAGSDTAQVAQLRLARVMAANDQADQALAILDSDAGAYRASYALARGDILLGLGRDEEARMAYSMALAESGQVGANLASVRQKLQSLAAAEVTASQEAMAQPESSDAQEQ
ncbi:MAG: tetratricopeptide repeat protein, partial [Halioglobus sp.]